MSKHTNTDSTQEIESYRGPSAPAVWIVVSLSALVGVIAILGGVF
jgi:hypothetical protein